MPTKIVEECYTACVWYNEARGSVLKELTWGREPGSDVDGPLWHIHGIFELVFDEALSKFTHIRVKEKFRVGSACCKLTPPLPKSFFVAENFSPQKANLKSTDPEYAMTDQV